MKSHENQENVMSCGEHAAAGVVKCLVFLTALLLLACGSGEVVLIEGQTVEVGCGRCIYEMKDVDGCPWAAQIDGRHYLLRGPVPMDHNSHEPDGICNMRRKAVIDGELRGELLMVSKMELLPAESVPEDPRFTPADEH
jgi:hypothetical protein